MLDEDDLRRRMASLRARDRRHVPSVDAVLCHTPPPRIRATRLLLGGGAAVCVIATLLVVSHRQSSLPSIDSIASWQAETDVLLAAAVTTSHGTIRVEDE